MLQWGKYQMVADKFKHKARYEDREDLRQDIILKLAEVERKYQEAGKPPLTIGGMFRVASYTIASYWRAHYKLTQGIDCGHCSKAQRQKCQQSLDRFAECPRKRLVVSLSSVVAENDGSPVELIDTLADDGAVDLDVWLDIRQFLYALPIKLVRIAYKKSQGYSLTNSERIYFYRHSKKAQSQLLQGVT